MPLRSISGRHGQLVDQASEKRDSDGCHTPMIPAQRCWTVKGKEGKRLSSLAFSIIFALQQSMVEDSMLVLEDTCLYWMTPQLRRRHKQHSYNRKEVTENKEKGMGERKEKASLACWDSSPTDLRTWEGYPGGQRDKGNKYRSVRISNCHYPPLEWEKRKKGREHALACSQL